ncbi:MAG TPA: restriction endonuclease subunit S [Vicinamibacterales bacterium]
MFLTTDSRKTDDGTLPSEWRVDALGSLQPFVTSGSRGWARFYAERGAPFIRITNLSRDSIYLNLADLKLVQLPPEDREGLRTQLQAGDLLVSITADIGIIGYVDERVPQPAYINQHIALVRFDPSRVDSKFLAYFLSSAQSQRLFSATTDIGAKAGMSLAGVLRIQSAFPALPEQHAIAAALSHVDALLEGLTRLIAKKRDLKQAAMQQLLTGQVRLTQFVGNWEARSLGEVCQKIQDGTHFSPKLGGGDFLYVTSRNIRFGRLDVSDAGRISSTEHDKIYARCDVRKGDLLLTKDGASTGNAALNNLDEPFSLLSSVALLRFDRVRHNPLYFMYQLLSRGGQEQIRGLMSGNAITRLTLTKIRTLRFPVPILAEQEAIAAVLSDMDAELEALEARREKTRALKQAMMQELLTGRTRLV